MVYEISLFKIGTPGLVTEQYLMFFESVLLARAFTLSIVTEGYAFSIKEMPI